MKLAYFSKNLPSDQPNGVSVQVHRLANEMVFRGHNVTCFSFSPQPETAAYHTVQLQWGTSSKLLNKFIPAIRFRGISSDLFDIVHYHGDDYLCRGSKNRVRTFYGSALQEAIHATTLNRFFYQSLFYIFELVSCIKRGRVVGISNNTQRSIPFVKKAIPCGVPLDIFNSGNGKKTLHPSIVFIGDFKSRKRGNLLLKIFCDYILPVYPESTLTVIGPQSCAGKNIIYAGRLSEPDLVRELQRSWIYCTTSSYEGFGVPVLEAIACGTAVVGIDNTGIRELFADKTGVHICKKQDLGSSLMKLIIDSDLRKDSIAYGLSKVRDYDIKMIAEQYESMYNRIVKKK
jgi:glycosyltransferase involved in cell wall biosynthesis